MAESSKNVPNTEKALAKITKAKVLEMEKKNTRSIFFYHSGGQWWKAIGASALIYFHYAKPKSPSILTSKLNPDTDGYSTSVEGSISIANIVRTVDELKRLGFSQSRPKDPEIIHLTAPSDFKSNNLKKWRGEFQAKTQQLNETITVESSDPALAAKVREFSRLVYDKIRKMDRSTQQLIGQHMLEMTRGLFVLYRKWAIENPRQTDGLERMLGGVEMLESDLLFLMDLNNGMQLEDIGKLSFHLEELRMLIKKRIESIKNQEGRGTT